jgi:hypothetical protein
MVISTPVAPWMAAWYGASLFATTPCLPAHSIDARSFDLRGVSDWLVPTAAVVTSASS